MSIRLLRTRGRRVCAVLPLLTLSGCLLAGTGISHARADDRVSLDGGTMIAPGVRLEEFSQPVQNGEVHGYLLTADLTNPHVSADLLTPGTVSARAAVSRMADDQRAVGGVNADFFNSSEAQHPGVPPTGAAVGPAIAHGQVMKSAVPDGQRFGPALPRGASTRDVIGISSAGVARLDRLSFTGSVTAAGVTIPLRGLNQYALPAGSVGAFTSLWGAADRERAVCGTDHHRADGCSTDTYEVTVRDGKVDLVSRDPGTGRIAPGTVVLVGREAGARALRQLRTGQSVTVEHRLVPAAGGGALRFAVGGFPVLRDGVPLPGLDARTLAVRTSAGFADHGHRLLLMSLDGGGGGSSRMTVAEMADLMRNLGADGAVDLDGGGSSTLVAQESPDGRVTVENHPSDGTERLVPEGIGIFSR